MIKREKYLKKIRPFYDKDLIKVITGIRRSGKSVILTQIMDELKDKGIAATAVCPGWMKTGLIDKGLIGAKKATKNFAGMVTPDVVAKKAISDADKGKDISVYSAYVKMCHLVAKILPQKVMMKLWLIQQK